MLMENPHFAPPGPPATPCPRVQELLRQGVPVNPNAVFRGHPQMFAPYVFDEVSNMYRPRCHCDHGAYLLLPPEREAWEITVEQAKSHEHGWCIKEFPTLRIRVTVNLDYHGRFWSGGTAWLLHDQSLPGERSDVAGGEVYPRGGKPKPSGWPDTIVMPEEVRYRHIEEHHHHYAPPEHIHHGQPAAQKVTLGGSLLKLFGGR